MGLGPVILLGIAAGILSVEIEIQRWRGDRECPAGHRARARQRTAVCFFLPGTPVGLSALDSRTFWQKGLRARR